MSELQNTRFEIKFGFPTPDFFFHLKLYCEYYGVSLKYSSKIYLFSFFELLFMFIGISLCIGICAYLSFHQDKILAGDLLCPRVMIICKAFGTHFNNIPKKEFTYLHSTL